jgi:hypothetical protein
MASGEDIYEAAKEGDVALQEILKNSANNIDVKDGDAAGQPFIGLPLRDISAKLHNCLCQAMQVSMQKTTVSKPQYI